MDPNLPPPTEPMPETPAPALTPQQQRRKRLINIALLAVVSVAIIFEICARLWLAYGKNVPMGRPDALIMSYYPELRGAKTTRIGGRDGHFDLLILSGSAFFDYYGGPAKILQRRLEAAGYENIRVWNMATPAHTTRDSLIKYRWLEDKHFDWVVVYHGINDLRANNVPDEVFKDDYSHMPWYEEINSVARKPLSFPRSDLAAPMLWNYMKLQWRGTAKNNGIDFNTPPSAEALEYGSKIKSEEAFGDNLKDIVDLSKERGDWLTLVTYGFYLDPKYSKERMEHDQAIKTGKAKGQMELSYAAASYSDRAQPCEVWGKPADLVAGIKAHNEQTSVVASNRKRRVGLIDFASKVPQEGKYFIDICHLSPAGVDLMTSSVMAQAPPLRSKSAQAKAEAAKSAAGVTTGTAAGATNAVKRETVATTGTQP